MGGGNSFADLHALRFDVHSAAAEHEASRSTVPFERLRICLAGTGICGFFYLGFSCVSLLHFFDPRRARPQLRRPVSAGLPTFSQSPVWEESRSHQTTG